MIFLMEQGTKGDSTIVNPSQFGMCFQSVKNNICLIQIHPVKSYTRQLSINHTVLPTQGLALRQTKPGARRGRATGKLQDSQDLRAFLQQTQSHAAEPLIAATPQQLK